MDKSGFHFLESSNAFDMATKKAVYGHYSWLVWKNDAMNTWHAARMTAENTQRAIAESITVSKKFFSIEANTGIGMRHGPGTAAIMLENIKNGHFQHA